MENVRKFIDYVVGGNRGSMNLRMSLETLKLRKQLQIFVDRY